MQPGLHKNALIVQFFIHLTLDFTATKIMQQGFHKNALLYHHSSIFHSLETRPNCALNHAAGTSQEQNQLFSVNFITAKSCGISQIYF